MKSCEWLRRMDLHHRSQGYGPCELASTLPRNVSRGRDVGGRPLHITRLEEFQVYDTIYYNTSKNGSGNQKNKTGCSHPVNVSSLSCQSPCVLNFEKENKSSSCQFHYSTSAAKTGNKKPPWCANTRAAPEGRDDATSRTVRLYHRCPDMTIRVFRRPV